MKLTLTIETSNKYQLNELLSQAKGFLGNGATSIDQRTPDSRLQMNIIDEKFEEIPKHNKHKLSESNLSNLYEGAPDHIPIGWSTKMANEESLYARQGTDWTDAEDRALISALAHRWSEYKIAYLHSRSLKSIRRRIEKLRFNDIL